MFEQDILQAMLVFRRVKLRKIGQHIDSVQRSLWIWLTLKILYTNVHVPVQHLDVKKFAKMTEEPLKLEWIKQKKTFWKRISQFMDNEIPPGEIAEADDLEIFSRVGVEHVLII